jgi:FAD/FMN-containing dehydrogenase/Fe-S oxidoreductase
MNLNVELSSEFINDLKSKGHFSGEIRSDQTTRILYSTDASIYRLEPLGVAFPTTTEDLVRLVETANQYEVPVLARGSGSSLAGQAIGKALIVDCSRFLNHIIEVNREEQTATVEPGLVLNKLNRAVSPYQLQYGPDPASAERATIGGCIANNATGAHSILYGMTADHILSLDVILSDGSTATLSEIDIQAAQRLASESKTLESKFYAQALNIRETYSSKIQDQWPHTWRRASGYGLNYLLPWSSTQPPQWGDNPTWYQSRQEPLPYPPILPNNINLAQVIAGSEGTLAIIQRAKLRLVLKPSYTALGVISFRSIVEACEAVPEILTHEPSAVELIPQSLINLARSVPAYAPLTSFADHLKIHDQDPVAYLVVEFAGEDSAKILNALSNISQNIWIAQTPAIQKQVWDVRKVGLGILMSQLGDPKPVAFIEDTSVPVDRLAEFVREIEKILDEHETTAEFYAHASAGCLHIRPILNLKTSQGIKNLRTIAEQTVGLALRLGGAVSAEHGDGFARGEWLERAYGKEIVQVFEDLKTAIDPKGIMNPGKIVHPPQMDQNLRYGETYKSQGWRPVFRFEEFQGEAGLVQAIEQCNGAGVCRKSEGVMCPSFQASQEEMYSTRGRSNLLRALISGQFPSEGEGYRAVKETLDLCLACKGCKSECPSGVDVAKLKYEFFNHYYNQLKHARLLRDYLFGYIGDLAKIGHPFAPVVNYLLATKIVKSFGDRVMGLSAQRQFPKMAQRSLESQWKRICPKFRKVPLKEEILFLSDAFTEYFQPEIGLKALEVLASLGCQIHILPTRGAGRTLISKSFLEAARKHGMNLIGDIKAFDPEGKMSIVGLEPSEVYTLRDEFQDLFPTDKQVERIAERSFTIEEFLVRPDTNGKIRSEGLSYVDVGQPEKVLYHAHCYQKAQPPAADGFPMGIAASEALLKTAGYTVQTVDDGCCGMAGAFGYEKEHFNLSMRVSELVLLPAVRSARQSDPSCFISASGVSCHAQIQDGTGIEPWHPVELIARKIKQ